MKNTRTGGLRLRSLVAIFAAVAFLISAAAPVHADSSSGINVTFTILGSDGVPINGAVATVILNIACYGCGTLDLVPVATQVSDAGGTITLNLPVGGYTMDILNPAGGIYQEIDFNVPQTLISTVRLSEDSKTVQQALSANPINVQQFTSDSAMGAVGNETIDWKNWFLPNDTFAGFYSVQLMQDVAGYQQTSPIYFLPYTSPPAMLFGLALLVIAFESTTQVDRKKKTKAESKESAR